MAGSGAASVDPHHQAVFIDDRLTTPLGPPALDAAHDFVTLKSTDEKPLRGTCTPSVLCNIYNSLSPSLLLSYIYPACFVFN